MYATKAEAAREGIRMLLSEGIKMRAMTASDWTFLVSLCDSDVQSAFAQRGAPGSPFTKLHMALRMHMDKYLSGYIAAT